MYAPFIQRHWATLMASDDAKKALEALPFVCVRTAWIAPRQLIDPRNALLRRVYAGDPVFPEAEFAEGAWLDRLCDLKMLRALDAASFMRAAQRVEAAGEEEGEDGAG